MIMVVLLLGVFGLSACGSDEVNKIDIGGENDAGKPMSIMAVRIKLDKDIFHRDDEIKIKLGFGFINESPVPGFVKESAVVVFKIEATGFVVVDESEVENNNRYDKEFTEYSDSKYVCTLDNERYIPNYYEVFEIEPISDMQSGSGTILVSATLDYKNGNYDGKNEWIYFVFNSETIAFSSISLKDAQRKLE